MVFIKTLEMPSVYSRDYRVPFYCDKQHRAYTDKSPDHT